MGNHSQTWHNRLFRDLVFTILQLDELYTRVRGIASARWLWLAIDPVSKAIPSLHIGDAPKMTSSHSCMMSNSGLNPAASRLSSNAST
jgi:hypothetical protein